MKLVSFQVYVYLVLNNKEHVHAYIHTCMYNTTVLCIECLCIHICVCMCIHKHIMHTVFAYYSCTQSSNKCNIGINHFKDGKHNMARWRVTKSCKPGDHVVQTVLEWHTSNCSKCVVENNHPHWLDPIHCLCCDSCSQQQYWL